MKRYMRWLDGVRVVVYARNADAANAVIARLRGVSLTLKRNT